MFIAIINKGVIYTHYFNFQNFYWNMFENSSFNSLTTIIIELLIGLWLMMESRGISKYVQIKVIDLHIVSLLKYNYVGKESTRLLI
jgi:hypothetical protein